MTTIKFEEIDGLYRPVFVCAECGQPIQGHGAGLIRWDRYDEPTFTVVHKNPCSWQWERKHGQRLKPSRELETFLSQLSLNTRHPFGEDQDHE